jgi:arylformamidase
MDIFPADKPAAPVLVYIHGGYWRGGSKEENCHFVEDFVRAGATVVLLEYDLCPSVTVSEIVRQMRSAIAWVYGHISEYGGDPSRLYISGLSAGGHLVAMDLDAVIHININEEVRLNPETARENNPFLHPPLPYTPLIVAVGGGEPKGWRHMSEDFFALCKERGVECEYLEIPDAHHFAMSARLAEPDGPLARAIFRQMGLLPPPRG